MTYSSQRKPNRRPAARRTSRRMQTAAGSVAAKPTLLGELWRVQRSKVLVLMLLLLMGGALFLVFETDTFYVFNFEIAGTKYLTPGEVEKASGIFGYNVFFVDPRAVERALQKLPEVKSAHVSTRLPNQVSVEIEERKPEITWLRGAETYWLDADGVAFRPRASLSELPVMRDLDQKPVAVGQRNQPAAVAALWAFRAAFPEGARSVEWSAERGLSFTDERGWKIYLGDADEMAGKVAKLRALIPELISKNARIKFIDLGKGEPYYQ